MLLLLPPSESKAAPAARGKAVDLDALSFPGLTAARTRVLGALVEVSAGPDAVRRLGVSPGLAGEVGRNVGLHRTPARPALEVYTGVLYDALDWPALSASARRRAASRVVVVSALWGALRPADRIPPYRLTMCGDLGLGSLTQFWRGPLTPVLEGAARGLVVDCRSGDYVAACPPSGDVGRRTVAVRVVQDGRTVSHMAKHTRGQVARHLLETGADPGRPQGLAKVLGERWPVELLPPARAGKPWTIDVAVPVPSPV